MRRRDFIGAISSVAAAWPVEARAQERSLPVVGYLSPGRADAEVIAAFRKGLAESGFVDGRNVAIEYLTDNNQPDRLSLLAADLVARKVAVIVAFANSAAVAARAATSAIPIVFAIGGDPVEMGLVASLNRPGGNITGASFLATDTVAKMMEMLHEVVPHSTVVAALVNPTNVQAEADTREAQEAARVLGLELLVLHARNERDIETAFANLLEKHAEALLIEGDALFHSRLSQLVVLTARHAMPAVFQEREFAEAGGLMSYGAPLIAAVQIAGNYAGRILKGEKPADLPVQRSTRVELIINLATAKALGIEVPTAILVRADHVIE